MKRTITAMFDRYEDAAEAVRRLETAGIAHSDVSIVSNDAANRSRYEAASATGTADDARSGTTTRTDPARADPARAHPDDDVSEAAGTGASAGSLLGGGAGLLAGLGLLAIPGLGPVVAAGWLASTLAGAGAGAVTGGLLGALTDAGVDEADAHTYAEALRRGGTVVTVRADEAEVDRVVDILDDEGTVNIDERERSWRDGGWTGRYSGSSDVPPGGAATNDPPSATTVGATSSEGTVERTGSRPRETSRDRARVRTYAAV